MTRTSPLYPTLAVIASQISINVGAALGKGLFQAVGPEGVAALRTGMAALMLLALARPWRTGITRKQMRWLILYGVVLGGMNLLIYWAIARIPLAIAVTIEICGPLAVVLITSRTAKDFLWLGMAAAGLLLLFPWSSAHGSIDLLGVAFALGAASCWASYILLGKRASEVESRSAVAIGLTVAACVAIPFGVATAGTRLLSGHILVVGAMVAFASSAAPYLLEMMALERLSSRVFGVVTSSAPAIAALVGLVVLNEHLLPLQWMAIALMIGASAGCSLTSKPVLEDAREDVVT